MLIRRTPIQPRALGTGSALCIAYFLLALGLLHYLRPDYAPAKHMISDYAVGAFGWLMTSAFVALSISCLMLMLGLAATGPRALPARIGVALLGAAFCGLVVTAIFPTDLPGSPETASGDIHNATFLLNVGSLLSATVLLTASFFRDARWRSVGPVAVLLAALVVAAFVLQFVSLRPGSPYGLANRTFVITLLSWLMLVSLRLRSVASLGMGQGRAVA